LIRVILLCDYDGVGTNITSLKEAMKMWLTPWMSMPLLSVHVPHPESHPSNCTCIAIVHSYSVYVTGHVKFCIMKDILLIRLGECSGLWFRVLGSGTPDYTVSACFHICSPLIGWRGCDSASQHCWK
jgi:hypothetical protein